MNTAYTHPLKAAICSLLFVCFSFVGWTQFDTQFWMPPIWDSQNSAQNQPSELFITTPFSTPVNVHVETADGTFSLDTTVVSGNPLQIPLSPTLGQTTQENTVLLTGFMISSSQPIQAVHKISGTNNQSLVTLKGRNGLGTDFWCGSQVRNNSGTYGDHEHHFITVMATENNTNITIETPFDMAATGGGTLSNPAVIQLNQNESYLIRGNGPLEHVAGAHVTSNKNIVVTSGSTHTRISGAGSANAADAGTDQLVPKHLMGNSFAVLKGGNGGDFDYAIIVATEDNTEVFVDGSATPAATLNAGEFYDYTLTGSAGAGHYLQTTETAYCFHVTGSSGDDEVGMSCIPQIECTGSRYIEFSRFTQNSQDQMMNFILSPEAIPTFEINGTPYNSITGVTTSSIPGLSGWLGVTLPNSGMQSNNVAQSEGFFHAGFLTGTGATGTYGFLSGFNDAFEFLDPNNGLPTTIYAVDTLCQGEQLNHCLLVVSCADDHNIIDFEGNEGDIVVTPGIPGFAFDTCFQYTAPLDFVGNDTITFTVDNRFGFEGQVDVIFQVIDPDTPIDAGPVQQLCSTTTGTLSAVNPDPLVQGVWSVLGGGAVITDPTSPTTTVTNLALGTNTFLWTQDYGCESNVDLTQIIVYDGTAPEANAGPDHEMCSSTSTYTMQANSPGVTATGTWDIIQGNATIFNINNASAPVSNLAIGNNVFEWTIENGPCPGGETTDQMVIAVFDENHPAANAGPDQSFCSTGPIDASLSANALIVPATGQWSVVSGTGTFANPNNRNTLVTGCGIGINTFRWTIDNGPCGELVDEVSIIVYDQNQTTIDAGDGGEYCTPISSHSLNAESPSGPAIGTWTVISGAGTFANPNSPNTVVSNLDVGENIFRWSVDNGPCAASGGFDDVVVTIFDNTTAVADAGEDQFFCDDAFSTATLDGNAVDLPALGTWTVISGSGVFADENDPNTSVSGLSTGVNTFAWTVDNGPCGTPSQDEVNVILFDVNEVSINAGSDAEYCTPISTHTMNASAVPAPAQGVWTLISGTGTIANPNNPTSNISGLGVGENIFRWTLDNGPCEPGVYFDEVSIFIFDENQQDANAGANQNLCSSPVNPTNINLNANAAIAPGVGTWTLVQGGGFIQEPNNPNTLVSGLAVGENIFEWTIDNGTCDPSSTSDQVSIFVFDHAQSGADAGDNVFLCSDLPSTTLAANALTFPATGTWTVVSGSATFADANDPNTLVSNVGLGVNVLQWTVNNGPCDPATSTDQMTITVNEGAVTVANAGPDASICSTTSSVTLAANVPVFPATGSWSVQSGTGTFTNPNAPGTTVSGLSIGENVLVWTLNNGACSGETTDTVSIFVFDDDAPNANAGADQSICSPASSVNLSATAPVFPAVGTWTVVNGTGTFADVNNPTSEVSGLSVGINTFRWTVNNAPCAPANTSDLVNVFVFDGTQASANAGADQQFCSPVSSTVLSANAVTAPGTGTWTLVSGSGNINNPSNPNTSVNGLGLGDNVFQWTISNGPCTPPNSSDQVTITIFDDAQAAANAGTDQEFCSPQNSTNLAANAATYPASGVWTLVSGSGDIANPSSPNTAVSNLGVGSNVFQWTISNGPCSPATTSDQVTILVFESSDAPADAGPDQELCLPTSSTTLAGNTPTAPSTGVWTRLSGAGTIQNPNSPTTSVSGLAVGENVFQWTINNGSCGSGSTSSTVSIFVHSNASPSANAGADQNLCTPETSTTLEGNTPVFPATGTWTLISGTGVFADATNPTTEVSGLSIGENIFQWTLDNGPCPGAITSDQVSIFVFDGGAPQPEAGANQILCTPQTSTTMSADAALAPGIGTWTLISGSGTITNPNDPNTTITGLGVGANVFQWTLDYATCGLQQDQVTITLYDSSLPAANAGVDQEFCSPSNSTNLNATAVSSPAIGTWSIVQGSGVIADPNNPNSLVENLVIGENIFVWTVNNGNCLAEEDRVDTVSIFVFDETQLSANAGSDQEICTPQSSVNLEANAITAPAIGTWSIVSGSGVFSNPNDPNATISNLGVGTTVLQWTVDNGNCSNGISSDTMSIFVFDDNQALADAGEDESYCTPLSSINLNGNALTAPATGTWTLLSGSATIQNPSNPNTLVSGLGVGENIFRWTVSNGPCSAVSNDVVSIFVYDQFNDDANAGADQEICTPDSEVLLSGNTPISPAVGTWTLVSGNGNIAQPNNPNSLVSGLTIGENIFQWTVDNGPCANGTTSDVVSIFVFDENAPLANAGADQSYCTPIESTTLEGNAAIFPGSGTWTLVSGSGSIADVNDPNTAVSGLSIGENIFEWTIYNGPCATSGSSDLVSIFIFDENQAIANAGNDQQVCTPSFSTNLSANPVTFPAVGTWTVIEGGANIINPNDPNTLVDNLSLGDNVFVWTIANGPCVPPTSTDTVLIQLFDLNAPVPNAGADQEFCLPTMSTNLEGSETQNAAVGTWTLIAGSGDFADENDPNTAVSNLEVGENTFVWTVDNGVCGFGSDTVSVFIFDPAAQTANAGENQFFCTPISTTTMEGNTPDIPGVGTWTLLTGTATIEEPNNPNTPISGLTIGENILCWTIDNGPCADPSTDCVSIFIYDENAPDAEAGADQEVCLPTNQVLMNAEAAIFPAIGTWTLLEGQGTIVNSNDPNTLITNLGGGTNVFQWTVNNSPCEQGSTSDTVEVRVFDENYTLANAGADQDICSPTSTTVLEGSSLDDPTTGTWTLIDGDGVIEEPNNPNTPVSALTVGLNRFVWTVSNGPCGNNSADTVDVFIFDQNQSPAAAGADQELCLPDNSTFVQGNNLIYPASGEWTLLEGAGTILNPNSAETEITDLELGVNTFVWTVNNGPCENGTTSDTLSISVFSDDANFAFAGEDISLCTPISSTTLNAAIPSEPSIGTWSIVSGEGTISDVNDPNAIVSGLIVGETVLQWTIYNGPCAINNTFDFVRISVFDETQTEAYAGEDQLLCAPVASTTLEADEVVSPAVGTWELISGSGNIEEINNPNSVFSNLSVGTNVLTWTLDNGVCGEATVDTVQVLIFDPNSPVAMAGEDQEFCTPFGGATLAGNSPIPPATGSWSLISGSGEISQPQIPNSTVFNLGFGESRFVWTVDNGPCGGISTDTVSFFLNDLSVANANAGMNIDFCGALDSLQLQGSETIGNTATGVWTILEGGGDFANVNNEFTYVYDIPLGVNTYLWTVDNGFCGTSSDTVSFTNFDPTIPSAFAGNDTTICGDDFLIFNLDASPYSFPATGYWTIDEGPIEIGSEDDPNTTVFDLGSIFVPLEDIVSTMTWTIDNGVCGTSSDSITFTLSDCLTIDVPDAFSPNGDGINDRFEIPNLFKYEEASIKIFNRWGVEVYQASPYLNDWDGTAQSGGAIGGGPLPVSTYYYIIDLGDGSEPQTGYIYLKR